MITTAQQAKDVQARRVAKGLRGRAKAVRRFLVKQYGDGYPSIKHLYPATFGTSAES